MLKKLTLENFFSFGTPQEIELNEGMNLLVGINGSGKTNFLRALELLHESVAGRDGLENLFLNSWGGINGVANVSGGRSEKVRLSFEFDAASVSAATAGKGFMFKDNPVYSLELNEVGASGYYLYETLTPSDPGSDFVYISMRNGRGQLSERREDKVQLKNYNGEGQHLDFRAEEPVLRQLSDPHTHYPQMTLKSAIEQIQIYHYFDTTSSSPIRHLRSTDSSKVLSANGGNLVSVLQRLKNHHTLAYEEIEKLLEQINPFFKEISFDHLRGQSLLTLREKKLDKTIPSTSISDGTLRYLLLLAILYNPERGRIICIDEPEIGLHPDMLNTIAAGMKHAVKQGTQLFVATHSPLLINAFDVEDIWVFEKDEQNQTQMSYKTEDDFEGWEGEFLAGQMWLSGKLGGVRW